MASTSVHDDNYLPTLSSTNIRSLDSAKVDKNHYISSYIRSQEAHLSTYALEGKSVAALWNMETADIPGGPSRDIELESGFGTPLLKPRVSARLQKVPDLSTSRECKEGPDMASGQNSGQAIAITENDNEAASRKASKSVIAISGTSGKAWDVGGGRLGLKDRGHLSKNAKKKSMPNTREDGDSDKEHRNRLAERRERRRTKKAIVDPKPDLQQSESGQGSAGSHASTHRRSKKQKKGKSSNIPAGLALMYGFSATNIGKNRLTLQLDPVVGVFNKGRASAKTSVQRSKIIAQASLFSEERFLNQTRAKPGDAASYGHQPDVSTIVSKNPPSAPKRKRVLDGEVPTDTRQRSPNMVQKPPSDQNNRESSAVEEPPNKRHQQPSRAASPIWDIELEDGGLPSDSGSGRSSYNAKSMAAGTVFMDTRAFSSRWAIANKDTPLVHGDGIGHTGSTESPNCRRRSPTPSICPSHSASQVVLCTLDPTISRFFPAPEPTHANAESPPTNPPARHGDYETAPSHTPQHAQEDTNLAVPPTVGQEVAASDHAKSSSWSSPGDHGRPVGHPIDAIHPRDSEPASLPIQVSSPAAGFPDRPVSAGVPSHISRSSSLCLPRGPPSPASLGPRTTTRTHSDMFAYIDGLPMPDNHTHSVAERRYLQDGSGDLNVTDQTDIIWHNTAVVLTDGVVLPYEMVADAGSMPASICDLASLQDISEQQPEDSCWPPDLPIGPEMTFYEGLQLPCHRATSKEEELGYIGHYQEAGDVAEEVLCGIPYADDVPGNSPDNCGMATDVDEGYWEPYDAHHDEEDQVGHAMLESEEEYEPASDITRFASPAAQAQSVDDEAQSDIEQDLSMLGSLQRFSQGRALLMGVPDAELGGGYRGWSGMTRMEEDVAKSLRRHWLPQKF